jgi:MoaA/NifB/PqqE/SkfB family radical SAM enzyme/polysaccharide pyruvyl transferase WcaK-like protein
VKFKITKFAPRYILDWYLRPSRRRNRTGLPTVLNLPVTDNCNSRCVMCDVWKTRSEGELSVFELSKTLSDPLFADIEHVGISGGEPTLRPDLVEIVAAIVDTLGIIRSLSITTHGFHSSRWEKFLPKIQEVCQNRSVSFVLNLSLDGIGEIHDEVRQIPGGYGRVIKTYQVARNLGVEVTFQSTISKPNVYGIVNILDTASTLDAEVDFRVATEIHRLDNIDSMKKVMLHPNEKSFFADFLVSPSLMRSTRSPARRLFYRDLSKRLIKNNTRMAPCYYKREGILLTPHGDLYHCSISKNLLGNVREVSPIKLYFSEESERLREALIKHICPVCIHDQSGAWSPMQLIMEMFRQNKFGGWLMKLVPAIQTLFKACPHIFRLILNRRKSTVSDKSKINNIVCIGMYGGEHVGDAAILGGVLLRLKQRYGVQNAYISSFRPDRTQRWVDSLELPIRVNVISSLNTEAYIKTCDALVLAGGPIMDLPEILLKQISYVSQSHSLKVPFLIEGVGIGPFKSKISEVLARILFRKAATISVRTINDGKNDLVVDLQPDILPDPAFDYINSRDEINESLLYKQEHAKMSASLESKDTLKIGLNLRPFWKKYVFSQQESLGLQNIFLLSLADALGSVFQAVHTPVKFYFFPMNSDQFGFSDLQIAYYLKKLLPPEFPLIIWETEPDVDVLIQFIQKMDAIIAMRFHAAIFALSQNIPVLGIDYAFGRDGKVSKLFKESGYGKYVCRVDTFNKDWMTNHLVELLDKGKQLKLV